MLRLCAPAQNHPRATLPIGEGSPWRARRVVRLVLSLALPSDPACARECRARPRRARGLPPSLVNFPDARWRASANRDSARSAARNRRRSCPASRARYRALPSLAACLAHLQQSDHYKQPDKTRRKLLLVKLKKKNYYTQIEIKIKKIAIVSDVEC